MGVICVKKPEQQPTPPTSDPPPTKKYNSMERISQIKEFLSIRKDEALQIVSGSECQRISITDFQIKQYIAEGGFGKVYTAVHIQTGKVYAMKIINKSQLIQQNSKLQAISERLILENLNNPFLVKLHFAFHNSSKIFMLVDYVERGQLFYIMRHKGKFTEDQTRFYAAEIFLALEYLHRKNIMYRDLKPENVLLGLDGHIKITDFGISKVFANFDVKTFSMCGTPQYIAPEVLKKKGYTFSSDWFSYGALVYDMLTGKPPFYSKNQVQIVQNKLQKKQVSLPRKLSSQAKSFLNGLLRIQPEQRLGAKGSDQIKNHPFFSKIIFDNLQKKEMDPPISIMEVVANRNIDFLVQNKSSSMNSSLLAKTFRSKLNKELKLASFQYNKYNKQSEKSIDEEEQFALG